MEDSSDALGYYDSGSFESGDYDWEFEEDTNTTSVEPVFVEDVLYPLTNRNNPELLLHLDFDTLHKLCKTNRRLDAYCQSREFWFLKLRYDYPGYVKYYQSATSLAKRQIFKDMTLYPKYYYVAYSLFRDCLDTISLDDRAKFRGEQWEVADLLQLLKGDLRDYYYLKILISFVLMYTKPTFEDDMEERGFGVFSRDALIYSLLPQFYGHYGKLQAEVAKLKEQNVLKWKILKCVVLLYYKLPKILSPYGY